MEIILLLLFFICSLVCVGHPLLRRVDRDHPPSLIAPGDTFEALAREKDTLQKTLDDLDFDFTLGKISEKDLNNVRERYLSEIRTIQEKLEERAQIEADNIDEAIEKEVREVRERRRKKKGKQ